jgi:hypothetical protein
VPTNFAVGHSAARSGGFVSGGIEVLAAGSSFSIASFPVTAFAMIPFAIVSVTLTSTTLAESSSFLLAVSIFGSGLGSGSGLGLGATAAAGGADAAPLFVPEYRRLGSFSKSPQISSG